MKPDWIYRWLGRVDTIFAVDLVQRWRVGGLAGMA